MPERLRKLARLHQREPPAPVDRSSSCAVAQRVHDRGRGGRGARLEPALDEDGSS